MHYTGGPSTITQYFAALWGTDVRGPAEGSTLATVGATAASGNSLLCLASQECQCSTVCYCQL